MIVEGPGSVWSKAARVRDLVRGAFASGDCGTLSTAFWSLGTLAGLPLRMVYGSANLLNAYDTHTTVAVWLARERRWAITDPTFGGYWSLGRTGRPIGVFELQRAVRSGRASALYWHSSGAPHAILPSTYYVDPRYLYLYINFVGFADDAQGAVAPDLRHSFIRSGPLFVTSAFASLRSTPPDATFPIRFYDDTSYPPPPFESPPAYARARLAHLTASLSDEVPLTIHLPATTAGFVVVHGAHSPLRLETGGSTYDLTVDGSTEVSPIAFLQPQFTLRAAATEEQVVVDVYSVRTFPRSHELSVGSP